MSTPLLASLKPLRLSELARSAETQAPLTDQMRRCRSMTNDSPRRSYAIAIAGVQRTVLERRASAADLGAEAATELRRENTHLSNLVNELRLELSAFSERLMAFESADVVRQRRIVERCDEVTRNMTRTRHALESYDPPPGLPTPRASEPLTPDVNDPQLDVDADFVCAHHSALFCDNTRRQSGQPLPDVTVAILDACAASEAKRHSFVALGRDTVRRWRQRNDADTKVDGDVLDSLTLVESLPECATASERRIAQIRDELKLLQENREQKEQRVAELLAMSRTIGPRSLAFEAVIIKRVLGVALADSKRDEYAALCRLSPHMMIDTSVATNGLFFAHGLTSFDTFAHLGRSAFTTFVLRARIAAFDDHLTADAYCRAAADRAPLWLETFFMAEEIATLLPHSWMHLYKSESEREVVANRHRRALPFALVGMFEFMNSLVCSRWLQRLLYEHYARSLLSTEQKAPAAANPKKLERATTIRRKRAK